MENENLGVFYISSGPTGAYEKSVESLRITKTELMNFISQDLKQVENTNNYIGVKNILEKYSGEDRISIWGASRGKNLKPGALVFIISYFGVEYMGEAMFKVSSKELSRNLWGADWKYQIGVKNVFKIQIPRKNSLNPDGIDFKDLFGVKGKGTPQSCNQAKNEGENKTREEVLKYLNNYLIKHSLSNVIKVIDVSGGNLDE